MVDFEKCKLAYKTIRVRLLWCRWQVYRLVYYADHLLLEVFNRVQKSFARRSQRSAVNTTDEWVDSAYRKPRAAGVQPGDDPDWGQVDSATLHDAIIAVHRAGHALLFTGSTDGGALGLVLCLGERRRKFYSHDARAVEAKLGELIAEFGEAGDGLASI